MHDHGIQSCSIELALYLATSMCGYALAMIGVVVVCIASADHLRSYCGKRHCSDKLIRTDQPSMKLPPHLDIEQLMKGEWRWMGTNLVVTF